jgi:hypothetical protein
MKKPDSPGLWIREDGVPMFVYRGNEQHNFRLGAMDENGNAYPLSGFRGNWCKITSSWLDSLRGRLAHAEELLGSNGIAEPAGDGEVEELRRDAMKWREHRTLENAKAPSPVAKEKNWRPVTADDYTTPAPPEVIDWQRLREWAADPRKKVPELAFTSGPEREIADLIMMCRVSIEPPEVIEGKGQAVTSESAGAYAVEGDGEVWATHQYANTEDYGGDVFYKGYRYIKLAMPTFPPRRRNRSWCWCDTRTGKITMRGAMARTFAWQVAGCCMELTAR